MNEMTFKPRPFNSFNFIPAHSLRMDGLIEIEEELTGIAAKDSANKSLILHFINKSTSFL